MNSVSLDMSVAHKRAQAFEAWGFKCMMIEDEPDKILIIVRTQG